MWHKSLLAKMIVCTHERGSKLGDSPMSNFESALTKMRNGKAMRRSSWHESCTIKIVCNDEPWEEA